MRKSEVRMRSSPRRRAKAPCSAESISRASAADAVVAVYDSHAEAEQAVQSPVSTASASTATESATS